MAKAVLVTYLTILSITFSSAYQSECAAGPEYWCTSFATANDCGALRHCTDTVWRYDAKSTRVESTTNCDWCQKILENSHQGIQHLATNEELIRERLTKDCRLFPFENVQTKCSNALKTYGSSVGSLMKHKRYATLCRLMDICSNEPVAAVPTTEKPIILGQKRCTWGPSYWCSSLSNTRECQAIEHCSTRVWSQQAIAKTSKNAVCQYCEYTIDKLRTIVQTAESNFNITNWLAQACSMLAGKDAIDDCTKTLSGYAEEVRMLIDKNINSDVICHLSHMCQDAQVEVRNEEQKVIEYESKQISIDEQSKMLCQVLVQATSELHFNQQKSRNEILDFLKTDCQKLDSQPLVDKCQHLVDKYGLHIHGHVASHIEPTKICDYLEEFSDHSSIESLPNVHCELCSFVLSVSKYMINAKQSQEQVLQYIDEQICSRVTNSLKVNCRKMIETSGKYLIDNIQHETKSMLLCTHFQICIDQVHTSISKNEKNQFLKENICDRLGTLKSACYAFLDRDSNRLMQAIVNDMHGDILCRMFGICPKKLSFLDDLSIRDDTNQCKRCIADFTRRKHIAEKLVNHSGEFLHHLCEQFAQKDDCIKTVDESLDALINFIRSMDPRNICVDLNLCNKTSLSQIQPDEIVIQEEVLTYIKKEVCFKVGTLREMCEQVIDTEGPSILTTIANDIDPKKACEILGICTKTSLFDNCNDKCECCLDKINTHQNQISSFFKGMIGSIQTVCEHMPNNQQCLQTTNQLNTNLDKITSKFNSKKICQELQHCSTLPIEIETLSQCQTRIESKKDFLLSVILSINQNLKSLCEYIPWNKDCYPIIDRSTFDVKDKLTQLNSESICTSKQSLVDVICMKSSPFEQLCRQLVQFDENSHRMEGIFRSMFNLNGEIDDELCELKSTRCPNLNNCSHCQEFSMKTKTYNLNMIETIRNGLLATCDWSLTKDYCKGWFNRVCDRLKDKVDKFQVENFCQQTNLCQKQLEIDPCQRCKTHFSTQTNRFRKIVSEITNSLTPLCKDNDCRSLVQSTQQQTLRQIDRIDPSTYCERYGYCLTPTTSYMARLLANPSRQLGVLNSGGFDDRLEIAIRQDICFQYGQFRPMCEHLMSSKQAHRFNYIYMSLLKNNPKLIDDDLREQLATQSNQDICSSCKQTVQSSIEFWNNSLESVRSVLLRTCEHCSVKDQCQDYYNRRFDNIQTYLNNFNVEQFCQNLRLCSTFKVIIVDSDQCSTCIQRLDDRRNALSQAVNRLADYFDELCQRFAPKQCQVFVKQIQNSIQQSIDAFNVNQTCRAMGFCSMTSQMDFHVYEKHFIENLETNLCEHLGPFESLCKQTLQGNRKQIQTVKINFNIKDVMQIGEQLTNGMTRNLMSAASLAKCNQDQCQCCVDRVNQKKECWKNTGDKLFATFSQTCAYCPAKQQCEQYWQTAQTQFDSYIDDIDPKQVCTRLGYCNASALCSNMGIYQQACEDALNKFTHGIEHDRNELEQHLPHTSVVVLPTKHDDDQLMKDSNSTCILCEYVMNILSNYIHQQSTEKEIEQSLEKICNQMPRTLQQQCHELVENYGPPIIAILIREFDLSVVCRKLNLCTSQMKVDLTHVNKASTSACGVCDYVSTYIDFTLKRDSSEKSLQHGLATVCTHLSTTEKSQCQTLVQLFTPNIRQMNLALGKNFCQQLPICQEENVVQPSIVRIPLQKPGLTKEEEEFKQKIVNNLDDTPECMLCRYVITYVDAIIKTNRSEEAIEAALKKVCTILPQKERAQCDQFVETYGPILAELISESVDPDTVCRYLGMCQVILPKETSTSKPVTYPNHDYVRISDEKTTYQCTICQYLMGRMKHFVQENQTEEEILASLKKSCKSFAFVNLQQQCENFLDQYGSYIIQMVASDVEPKVACQNLGLCQKNTYIQSSSTVRQSTPATSKPYGKCIFGMSYWCTSRQNAELCNAVELCENQVWSKKNKKIVI